LVTSVTNIGNPSGTYLDYNSFKALGFKMGSQSVTFLNMLAEVQESPAGAPVYGGIYSDNSGKPGALLVAFNPVTTTTTSTAAIRETLNFNTSISFTLQASTSYWFMLYGSAVTVYWTIANLPTLSLGVTRLPAQRSNDGGSTWTTSSAASNVVQINGVYTTYSALTGSITQFSRDQISGALTALSPNTVALGSTYVQRN